LIDLRKAGRIDNTGLGMLMHCYAHLIRNRRMPKLFNPRKLVRRALSMTGIDSVVEVNQDESCALRAFNLPPGTGYRS
jgi:anti-anti-sigma regulatory factor